MPKNVHVDTTLSDLSVLYKHEPSIWREVMPTRKVTKRSNVFFVYDKDDSFRVPSDQIGPRTKANEVDFNLDTDNYSVRDHGLSDFVDQEQIDDADAPLSPQIDANEFINQLLDNAQEKRVSTIVFDEATYPAANKVQLSGTDQWSDPVNSTPLDDLFAGLDLPLVRPNTLVLGALVWTQLRKHPQILDAVRGSIAGGIVTKSELAEVLEIEKVVVGRKSENTAKKGQTGVFSKLWGKHASLLFIDPNPGPKSITFGVTFMSKDRSTQRIRDDLRGVSGGEVVKTTWNSDEKVIAADVGYFIEDAIA